MVSKKSNFFNFTWIYQIICTSFLGNTNLIRWVFYVDAIKIWYVLFKNMKNYITYFWEAYLFKKKIRFLQNKDNKWKSLIHRGMFSSFSVVFFLLFITKYDIIQTNLEKWVIKAIYPSFFFLQKVRVLNFHQIK